MFRLEPITSKSRVTAPISTNRQTLPLFRDRKHLSGSNRCEAGRPPMDLASLPVGIRFMPGRSFRRLHGPRSPRVSLTAAAESVCHSEILQIQYFAVVVIRKDFRVATPIDD